MSTLKTTNLQHPSAVDPAIVLDADGDVTYSGVHDFSAATVTGAPQGLVHIATETFSAVSSVSLNDVFTSDYDNYEIKITATYTTESAYILFRVRAGGTDLLSSYENSGGVIGASTVVGVSGASTAITTRGISTNSDIFAGTYDILTPFLASKTGVAYRVSRGNSFFGGGSVQNTTSYDGFSMITNTGTFSGTLRVYGYSNGA